MASPSTTTTTIKRTSSPARINRTWGRKYGPRRQAKWTSWKRTGMKMAKATAAKRLPPAKFRNYVELMLASQGKKFGIPYIEAALKAFGQDSLSVKAGKWYISVLDSPGGDFIEQKGATIPSSSIENSRRISGRNNIAESTLHTTVFTAGNPTTKNLKLLGKLNGNTKLKYFDTLYQAYDSAAKSVFNQTAGFNQKSQALWNTLTTGFTIGDMNSLFNITYASSSNTEYAAYACIYNLQSKMKITTERAYLPCFVRINLISYKDESVNYKDALASYLNTVETATQINGSMPIAYQLENGSHNSQRHVVLVDPTSSGIKSADRFKSDCTIVKSYTKKLYPGDMWNFEYNHRCGPGIRLDKIKGAYINSSVNNETPLGYAYIVETWGAKCEAIINSSSNNGRIRGTAPSSLAFEFQKSISGVLPSTVLSNATPGGFENIKFATRTFSQNLIPSLHKITNYDVDDITDGPTFTADTGIYIPVMSDSVVQFAKTTSTGN
jgi:hypothetical protein